MTLTQRIKDAWYKCTEIFELSCFVSLGGIEFHLVILGQKLALDIEIPDCLTFKLPICLSYYFGPEKWILGANVDYELSTGFSLRWHSHEYTPLRTASVFVLGGGLSAEYLSDLGWDDKNNKYFKLNTKR